MAQSTFEFVRDNIAQTPFHQWLLPELLEVNEEAGSVTIRLPVRPEFCRLPGRPELHGAVVAAMVDISGHAAVAARCSTASQRSTCIVTLSAPASGTG
jgi:acyl-coenzyme A thioesterase PaaI-like protein